MLGSGDEPGPIVINKVEHRDWMYPYTNPKEVSMLMTDYTAKFWLYPNYWHRTYFLNFSRTEYPRRKGRASSSCRSKAPDRRQCSERYSWQEQWLCDSTRCCFYCGAVVVQTALRCFLFLCLAVTVAVENDPAVLRKGAARQRLQGSLKVIGTLWAPRRWTFTTFR